MNEVINEYPDLPAVVTNIEMLIYEANKCKGKDRREKIKEANRLAAAYQQHCKQGGNHATQFKKFE